MPDNERILEAAPLAAPIPQPAVEAAIGINENDLDNVRRQLYRIIEENPYQIGNNNNRVEEVRKPYNQLLKESIPEGWRLIKRGEILVYPCMVLKDNYRPELGWKKTNVLGVDKLNRPFQIRWGNYLIPKKTKTKNT